MKSNTIPLEGATYTDILCGRDKRSYNHVANRRFRFLTALNVDRYRDAVNRRNKTLVVHSIYNQIIESGGRFLVRRCYNDDHYVLLSDKAAREKISHALRDKLPLSFLGNVKNKLQRRQRGALSESRFIEEAYIAANALLLRVHLPQARHASDDYVEIILTGELEKMCNPDEPSTTIATISNYNTPDLEITPYTQGDIIASVPASSNFVDNPIQPTTPLTLCWPLPDDVDQAPALPFYHVSDDDDDGDNSTESGPYDDIFDASENISPQIFSEKESDNLLQLLDSALIDIW